MLLIEEKSAVIEIDLKTPVGILTKALESFEDGKRWYQGGSLYNLRCKYFYGDPLDIESFCAYGGIAYVSLINRLTRAQPLERCYELLDEVVEDLHHQGVPVWNDDPTTTFADVQEVFNRAIIKAQQPVEVVES